MAEDEGPEIAAVLAKLAGQDVAAAEDARAALEWIAGNQDLAFITQQRIQNFCWYELPVKWFVDLEDRLRVVAALAQALDLLQLPRYAGICRSATTREILGAYETSIAQGKATFRRAATASGVMPPDLPDFQWGPASKWTRPPTRPLRDRVTSQVPSTVALSASAGPCPGRGRSLMGRSRGYCGGMGTEQAFPVIRQMVLDTTDPRRLAEFYRQLFGLRYTPGDEPPGPGQPDPKGQDWLILTSPAGGATLAFQKVAELPEATWPDGPVPQQAHLDTTVPGMADLDVAHERALALGARLLEDRSDDPEEPLRVYADPAGHPFCIIAANLRSGPSAE